MIKSISRGEIIIIITRNMIDYIIMNIMNIMNMNMIKMGRLDERGLTQGGVISRGIKRDDLIWGRMGELDG